MRIVRWARLKDLEKEIKADDPEMRQRAVEMLAQIMLDEHLHHSNERLKALRLVFENHSREEPSDLLAEVGYSARKIEEIADRATSVWKRDITKLEKKMIVANTIALITGGIIGLVGSEATLALYLLGLAPAGGAATPIVNRVMMALVVGESKSTATIAEALEDVDKFKALPRATPVPEEVPEDETREMKDEILASATGKEDTTITLDLEVLRNNKEKD